MPLVVIKSNTGVSTPVLIADLGFRIPVAGSVQLEDDDAVSKAIGSRSLSSLLTDNAFGNGSSTLVLNDGLTDIPQEQALAFLAAANLPDGFDSLTKNLAEDSFVEIVRAGGKITQVVTWTNPLKTQRIRETTVTYDQGKISVVADEQYNAGGALLRTLTSTVGYSGGLIANVTTEVS